MFMHELINNEDVFIPLLVFTGIVLLVLIKSVTRVITGNAQERTKREIAAYVAEGSMTPEQAERILKAGRPKQCG